MDTSLLIGGATAIAALLALKSKRVPETSATEELDTGPSSTVDIKQQTAAGVVSSTLNISEMAKSAQANAENIKNTQKERLRNAAIIASGYDPSGKKRKEKKKAASLKAQDEYHPLTVAALSRYFSLRSLLNKSIEKFVTGGTEETDQGMGKKGRAYEVGEYVWLDEFQTPEKPVKISLKLNTDIPTFVETVRLYERSYVAFEEIFWRGGTFISAFKNDIDYAASKKANNVIFKRDSELIKKIMLQNGWDSSRSVFESIYTVPILEKTNSSPMNTETLPGVLSALTLTVEDLMRIQSGLRPMQLPECRGSLSAVNSLRSMRKKGYDKAGKKAEEEKDWVFTKVVKTLAYGASFPLAAPIAGTVGLFSGKSFAAGIDDWAEAIFGDDEEKYREQHRRYVNQLNDAKDLIKACSAKLAVDAESPVMFDATVKVTDDKGKVSYKYVSELRKQSYPEKDVGKLDTIELRAYTNIGAIEDISFELYRRNLMLRQTERFYRHLLSGKEITGIINDEGNALGGGQFRGNDKEGSISSGYPFEKLGLLKTKLASLSSELRQDYDSISLLMDQLILAADLAVRCIREEAAQDPIGILTLGGNTFGPKGIDLEPLKAYLRTTDIPAEIINDPVIDPNLPEAEKKKVTDAHTAELLSLGSELFVSDIIQKIEDNIADYRIFLGKVGTKRDDKELINRVNKANFSLGLPERKEGDSVFPIPEDKEKSLSLNYPIKLQKALVFEPETTRRATDILALVRASRLLLGWGGPEQAVSVVPESFKGLNVGFGALGGDSAVVSQNTLQELRDAVRKTLNESNPDDKRYLDRFTQKEQETYFNRAFKGSKFEEEFYSIIDQRKTDIKKSKSKKKPKKAKSPKTKLVLSPRGLQAYIGLPWTPFLPKNSKFNYANPSKLQDFPTKTGIPLTGDDTKDYDTISPVFKRGMRWHVYKSFLPNPISGMSDTKEVAITKLLQRMSKESTASFRKRLEKVALSAPHFWGSDIVGANAEFSHLIDQYSAINGNAVDSSELYLDRLKENTKDLIKKAKRKHKAESELWNMPTITEDDGDTLKALAKKQNLLLLLKLVAREQGVIPEELSDKDRKKYDALVKKFADKFDGIVLSKYLGGIPLQLHKGALSDSVTRDLNGKYHESMHNWAMLEIGKILNKFTGHLTDFMKLAGECAAGTKINAGRYTNDLVVWAESAKNKRVELVKVGDLLGLVKDKVAMAPHEPSPEAIPANMKGMDEGTIEYARAFYKRYGKPKERKVNKIGKRKGSNKAPANSTNNSAKKTSGKRGVHGMLDPQLFAFGDPLNGIDSINNLRGTLGNDGSLGALGWKDWTSITQGGNVQLMPSQVPLRLDYRPLGYENVDPTGLAGLGSLGEPIQIVNGLAGFSGNQQLPTIVCYTCGVRAGMLHKPTVSCPCRKFGNTSCPCVNGVPVAR